MDTKTLEALKQSIKKWYKIAYNRGVDNGASNCQLCIMFRDRFLGSCGCCPVKKYSGEGGCEKTPYKSWIEYIRSRFYYFDDWRVFDEKSQQLAIAEYKFLKSLLPENQKDAK